MRWLHRRAPELLAAASGLFWFGLLGGWRALPPTSLDWLGDGDRAQHLLSWLFFRRAPWTMPLGFLPNLITPVGTTVGFTDGNPLMALAFKPFSQLLPVNFQYMGLWLGLCFMLQGYWGARTVGLFSKRAADRLAGGVLLVTAPWLTHRLGHQTLCAQAGITFLVYLNLKFFQASSPESRASPRDVTQSLTAAALLSVIFAAIHPYLAMMLLALTVALAVQLCLNCKLISKRHAFLWLMGTVVAQALVFLLLGYLTQSPSHGSGYGEYSSDLSTFWNADRSSRFFSGFPILPNQQEGMAYLGLGGLLGLALACVLLTRERGWHQLNRLWPLLGTASLLALFAITPLVRLKGHLILEVGWLQRALIPLAASFRASGRFIWPLATLLVFLPIGVILRSTWLGPQRASAMLVGLLILQLADLSLEPSKGYFPEKRWRRSDPRWNLASATASSYRHLLLYPPQIVGVWSECRGLVYANDNYYVPLAYLAYSLGLDFNSGQVARGPGPAITQACRRLNADVDRGQFDPDSIYIVHASQQSRFTSHPETLRCGFIGGDLACVSKVRPTAFGSALELPIDSTQKPAGPPFETNP